CAWRKSVSKFMDCLPPACSMRRSCDRTRRHERSAPSPPWETRFNPWRSGKGFHRKSRKAGVYTPRGVYRDTDETKDLASVYRGIPWLATSDWKNQPQRRRGLLINPWLVIRDSRIAGTPSPRSIYWNQSLRGG